MIAFDDIHLDRDGFAFSASFRLEARVKLGVIGPSGAGKSTLLAVAGGFVVPDRGRVTINGQDVTQAPPHRRAMAHLFQDNNLFPHMTAAQNAGLGIRPSLSLRADEVAQVSDALSAVGLTSHADKRPAALSGGEQARVALARLLVQAEPIVLMDEPFAALGPAMRRDMVGLSKDLGDRLEATMIMVSHDLDDIMQFSDQVVWVENGMCAPPRDKAAFLADPPQGFRDYAGH